MSNRIEEIKSKMEGLDKRTKEYKELKEELALLNTEVNAEEVKEESDIVSPEKEESTSERLKEAFDDADKEFSNKSIVSVETYEKVKTFNGRVSGDELNWLFKTYNTTFGTSLKKCLCPGKIKRMINKLRVTFERDNNIK